MNVFSARKFLFLVFSMVLSVALCGCGPEGKDIGIEKPVELNTTVGALARLYESGAVSVRGFGIVAGLAGTENNKSLPAKTTLTQFSLDRS